MLSIKIDYDKRIYGYDLLRAYAIFRVVNGHGGHLLNGTIFENFPWFISPSGVDIFFVLSGFLIGYSFISNINKKGNKNAGNLSLNFWKRSSLRILPNYYLILIINYYLVQNNVIAGNTEKFHIGLFATFTQNLWYPFYGFFWESWSIAVQEWFYLLFPLLMIILTRIFNIKYSIWITFFIFLSISVIYRSYMSSEEYDYFFWDLNFRKVTASRLDSISFGFIAAWIRYYLPSVWKKYAIHSFILGIGLFVAVVYIPFQINTIYSNIVFLSITSIAIMLGFPLIDQLKNVRTRVGRFISHISILSYAIYLLNLLIIQIINKNFPEMWGNYGIINYLTYWAITIIGSYILYKIIENPFSVYGNKLLHTTQMMYKRKVQEV